MSFNSTLVQLKVANRRKGSASSFSFNSTLVQLKDDCKSQTNFPNQSFNSTLVQLKVVGLEQIVKILDLFQFYLSSIKRLNDFGAPIP